MTETTAINKHAGLSWAIADLLRADYKSSERQAKCLATCLATSACRLSVMEESLALPLGTEDESDWRDQFDERLHRVASFQDGFLVREDAVRFLTGCPPSVADILFLAPPFNLGKKYGVNSSREDRLPAADYDDYLEEVLAQSIRVLADGGSLFLYHVPKVAMRLGDRLSRDLDFRHWIAVSMKNGYSRPAALYPAHYALLYFTKGRPGHFARPKVPIALCRHCKKPIKDYGGYARHVEGGLNLSDFWDDISPVRHRSTKTRTANELPVRLMERVFGIAGFARGLVIDPFAGSGLTGIVARDADMRFVLNDRESTTCEQIVVRLSLKEGVGGPRQGHS